MTDHCDACIWELADTPCPECVETIQRCADQDDSNFIDFGEPHPVVVPAGFLDYFKGAP